MIKCKNLLISTLLTIAISSTIGFADEKSDQVKENLSRILPSNMPISSIEESPMEGVYIVDVGGQAMYVYSKGDFVMVGDVYDSVRQVSLGEEQKALEMSEALAGIPDEEVILMSESKPRYVTVFTDTDCFYCQKFHKTVSELEARGMQVRYLMFPRAGLESESYNEAVSVWCAEDQARAMTIAKSGGAVEAKTCENPVAQQYELGQQLGVRGTPTMILDNGKVIPGYVTPDQLFSEAGAIN